MGKHGRRLTGLKIVGQTKANSKAKHEAPRWPTAADNDAASGKSPIRRFTTKGKKKPKDT